jgi:hypothetical protein
MTQKVRYISGNHSLYRFANGFLVPISTPKVQKCLYSSTGTTMNSFNAVHPDLPHNKTQKVWYFSGKQTMYRCSLSSSALFDAEGAVLQRIPDQCQYTLVRVASVVVSDNVGFIAFSNQQ